MRVNLKYFEASDEGFVEKSASFSAKTNADRDMSNDKLFAQNLNEEIVPMMEGYNEFSNRLSDLSKQFNAMNNTRSLKLKM
jgi:hypothetical protein